MSDQPGHRPGETSPGRWGGSGFGRVWPFLGGVFVAAFLVPALVSAANSDLPRWESTLVVIDGVLYAAGYLGLPYLMFGWSQRGRVIASVTMLLLGGLLVTGIGANAIALMIFAMALPSMWLPLRWALPLIGGTLAVTVLVLLLDGRFTAVWDGFVGLATVTLCLTSMGQLLQTNRALRAARDEIATLAVAEERGRLARDLHDILGHSLTTITLKAGLARRLLESTDDRERAIGEIHEVEELSRQALGDVRATVSGYREVSLSAEIVIARAALRAAEVKADLPHAVDNVRPEFQQVFGYVLREGVTNVLRHSTAGTCQVRLGETWIEVSNDGPAVAAAFSTSAGNGLCGLTERLAQVGGQIEAGPLTAGGYRLRASVPVETSAAAKRVQPEVGFA